MFLVFYNLSLKTVLNNSSKLRLNVLIKVLDMSILASLFLAYFQTSLMFLLMFSNGPIEWTSFELSEKNKGNLDFRRLYFKNKGQ